MTDRRFTDKAALDPWSVRGLALDHAAMAENRSLFPSTVVDVTRDAPDRLLVSGANNRKLGATITKGMYAGYSLCGLSLEERATCPASCDMRSTCYGNAMQLARRHRIVDLDVFHDRLAIEIDHLIKESARGLMVRLHVLGDFPSVEYVAMWADLLADFPKLAVYGYTHRLPTRREENAVGNAIQSLKENQTDRFRIRWSGDLRDSDSARVVRYVPATSQIPAGVVCPAQLKADACCASCAFCWEPKSRAANVVFILHGAKSAGSAAENAMAEIAARQVERPPPPAIERSLPRPEPAPEPPTAKVPLPRAGEVTAATPCPSPQGGGVLSEETPPVAHDEERRQARPAGDPLPFAEEDATAASISGSAAPEPLPDQRGSHYGPSFAESRRITPISIPSKFKPNEVLGAPPELRMVSPLDLLVEPAYQRDLSGRSVSLIRKIVTGFDWAKFKPPICAETRDGLFVIDGQHTAIASACHPGILRIPVLIVGAEHMERRADAFVAHNRDRLAMSALQIFHAEVAAGGEDARAIWAIVERAGASVPRSPPLKGEGAAGQIVAINELRSVYRAHGAVWTERILRIATLSGVRPVSQTVLRALKILLSEQRFSEAALMSDQDIAAALGSIADVESASQRHAVETGQGRYRACVMLIIEATRTRQAA